MVTRVRIEGLRELDAALATLPKAVAKGVLRRVLVEAAEPVARKMRALAPRGPKLNLVEGIGVGTRLTKKQAAQARRTGKNFQEMYIGTADPAGQQQEFGNSRHGAQPWARPAWDSEKMATLDRIGVLLGVEIDRAVQRQSRRASKG